MIEVGKETLRKQGATDDIMSSPSSAIICRLGFHRRPWHTIGHLHLHCIGLPFKNCWSKFSHSAPFLVSAEKVKGWIEWSVFNQTTLCIIHLFKNACKKDHVLKQTVMNLGNVPIWKGSHALTSEKSSCAENKKQVEDSAGTLLSLALRRHSKQRIRTSHNKLQLRKRVTWPAFWKAGQLPDSSLPSFEIKRLQSCPWMKPCMGLSLDPLTTSDSGCSIHRPPLLHKRKKKSSTHQKQQQEDRETPKPCPRKRKPTDWKSLVWDEEYNAKTP